jgi:dolichol-phosphate mannosyltransferase
MISTFKVAIILGLKDKSKFIKFGIVGFVGYLVNALSLSLFTKWQFPGPLAWACAVELAIINNFLFNNVWTFKSQKITGVVRFILKFGQFNLTSLGALIIQTVFGTLTDVVFGVGYRQQALPFIILFLILPYNYFMYNKVIWKTKKK